MRIISGLIKYQYLQYLKSNKFVMPFAAFVVILFTLYSTKPVSVVASLASCCLFVFLISSWIGTSVCSLEDTASEQIMILRLRSTNKYDWGHALFLLSLSMLTALLCLLIPVLINLSNSQMLFDRKLLPEDIIFGFFLLSSSAFMGCSLGELSHPRVIKDRKSALLMITLVDIVSVIKTSLTAAFPVSKFILWIVPPISFLPDSFAKEPYFIGIKVFPAVLLLFIYGLALTFVKISILQKRKF